MKLLKFLFLFLGIAGILVSMLIYYYLGGGALDHVFTKFSLLALLFGVLFFTLFFYIKKKDN